MITKHKDTLLLLLAGTLFFFLLITHIFAKNQPSIYKWSLEYLNNLSSIYEYKNITTHYLNNKKNKSKLLDKDFIAKFLNARKAAAILKKNYGLNDKKLFSLLKSQETLIKQSKKHIKLKKITPVLLINKCNISSLKLRSFTEKQERILEKTNAPKTSQMLEIINGWKQNDINCLLQTLLTSKQKSYESIYILKALNNRGNISNDILDIMLTIRYLQLKRYSECLGTLINIIQIHPELKTIYQSIQRIYAFSNKGKGAVGLRQSL